jgi:hypothetical protein
MHKALCMETVLILETKLAYICKQRQPLLKRAFNSYYFLSKYFLQRLLVKKHNFKYLFEHL